MVFVKFTGGNNLQDYAWCLRSLQHKIVPAGAFQRNSVGTSPVSRSSEDSVFISNPSIIVIIQIDLFNRLPKLQPATHVVKSVKTGIQSGTKSS